MGVLLHLVSCHYRVLKEARDVSRWTQRKKFYVQNFCFRNEAFYQPIKAQVKTGHMKQR